MPCRSDFSIFLKKFKPYVVDYLNTNISETGRGQYLITPCLYNDILESSVSFECDYKLKSYHIFSYAVNKVLCDLYGHNKVKIIKLDLRNDDMKGFNFAYSKEIRVRYGWGTAVCRRRVRLVIYDYLLSHAWLIQKI